jgi:NADH:ubiquinone oxidoreductase subunit C
MKGGSIRMGLESIGEPETPTFSYINLLVTKQLNLIQAMCGRHALVIKLFKDFEIFIKKESLHVITKLIKLMTLFRYNYLVDVNAVDFIKIDKFRFRVSYTYKSPFNSHKLVNLFFFVGEFESVASLSSVFCSAGWLEREVWDMYGILFYNH